MFKKIFLAVSIGLACGFGAAAQDAPAYDAKLAGSQVYSDPGFQDFIETTYGYLKPGSRLKPSSDFRDAVVSDPSAAGEKYIFVRILPRSADYSSLVKELSASAGFRFRGERTVSVNGRRTTKITGWVKAGRLEAVRKNPGVAGVSAGRGKGARNKRSSSRVAP